MRTGNARSGQSKRQPLPISGGSGGKLNPRSCLYTTCTWLTIATLLIQRQRIAAKQMYLLTISAVNEPFAPDSHPMRQEGNTLEHNFPVTAVSALDSVRPE